MGEATEFDVAPLPPATAETPKAVDETLSSEGADEKVVVSHDDPSTATEEEKAVVPSSEREASPAPSAEDVTPAFVEETYYAKDLKDSEKKALQDLKAKIEEAIKGNSFLAPAKPAVEATSREMETEKKEGDGEKADHVEEMGEGEMAASKAEEPPAAAEDPPTAAKDVKEDVPPTSDLPLAPPSTEDESSVPASETKDLPAPAPEAADADTTEATSRDISIDEDDSPSLEDLALWGVPLLYSKGDERTDVILLKFLRARDFKVNEAMGMLKDTMLWRKEFDADSVVDEEITSEYDSVAYMHGLDKEGHPVCYNHYSVFQDKELYQKTFGDEAQFKKFLRWRIQVLEKGIEKLDFSPSGVHSMVQITDFKDSPGLVKRRNITKKALTLLQDNYPELVAKQIFINVPWYFGALYSLYGKIATPRSKSKMVAARPEKVTETLFKYISPENVPLKYGGWSRPGDTEFENIEAPVKRLVVKASEKQTIELPVEEGGSTVVWDVTVAGWDLVYGEEFVPSAENAYTVIIQKSKKMASLEEPVRNSFKATEPGKVVLTVDNTSRRTKSVVYRHLLKKDNPTECC